MTPAERFANLERWADETEYLDARSLVDTVDGDDLTGRYVAFRVVKYEDGCASDIDQVEYDVCDTLDEVKASVEGHVFDPDILPNYSYQSVAVDLDSGEELGWEVVQEIRFTPREA